MSSHTTFIGVDLAWKSDKNHSGVVIAHGSVDGMELIACSNDLARLEDVLEYVIAHTTENTVLAIDAPLVISNQTGQRPCEKLIGQRFGARHASAHTSNLNLYPNAGSVRFECMLRANGFLHEPCLATDMRKPGKWFFEVYPHPAQIVLFNRKRIIKYKKGTVPQKRAGLKTLRESIHERLVSGNPPLHINELLEKLLTQNLDQLAGKRLKHYEDMLDACFCAYLAFYYWYWGRERNEMIGELQSGYIINSTEAATTIEMANR
jgi:predicted RNase H-like nuclease